MPEVDSKKTSTDLLIPELKEYFFTTLGHKYLTAVQQCTICYFLANYDCVVQAPTGSGKTLAYLLPTLQLISQKRIKFNEVNKCEIYALIVIPSRELVVQIYDLLKTICEKLNFKLLRLVGGVKIQPEKFFKGQCLMLATPGCLEHWSEKLPSLKNYLKPLLVLILDEADRYSNAEFQKSMTSFMALLPKQRRTGLFSATQAKTAEDFLRFGLRNPIRLNVSSDKSTNISESLEIGDNGNTADNCNNNLNNDEHLTQRVVEKEGISNSKQKNLSNLADLITPAELINYYTLVEADDKFLALVNMLDSIPNAKVLLFLCSSACVEYFAQILPEVLVSRLDKTSQKQRSILALHGKLDKKKRVKTLQQFRKSQCSILLSTDLMARGLDLIDIDWVLQYDIPKYSSMFIHRSGRTARIGHEGKSLIFLTKEEAAYVDFIQNHEKIHLKEWNIDGLGFEEARKLRAKIQDLAISDRAVLENGTRAFVSFVQAYVKHDCNVVCRLNDLNVAGLAHSYSLLRLPQMVELRKRTDEMKELFEARVDIRTSQIPYKNNPKAETRRQELLRTMHQGSSAAESVAAQGRRKIFNGDDEHSGKNGAKERQSARGLLSNKRTLTKRPRKPANEWEDLKESANLLKKFKKGKLSRNDMEEML